MARRRRSYGSRRSYSSRGRSSYRRSPRRQTRRYGGTRRASGGQTLRLVLQQPGAQQQRPPFGTFQPTAMFSSPLMQHMLAQAQGGMPLGSGMAPGQGLTGGLPPGARAVLNPQARSPAGVYVPPGYKLVPEVDGGGDEVLDD